MAAFGCGEKFVNSSGGGGDGGASNSVTATSTTTDTSSSSAGTGGGEECVATGPEICNGLDDDCMNGVDDGCPLGLVLEGGTYQGHEMFHVGGDENFSDICPSGSAIIQLSGFLHFGFTPPAVNTVTARCAEVLMVEDASNGQFSYRVIRGNIIDMDEHGGGEGAPFTLDCPENAFAIGLEGFADSDPNIGVQQSRLHCATLEIAQDDNGFFVEHGTTSVVGLGDAQNYSDVLDSPRLMTRYRGIETDWIQSIGIGHDTPVLMTK